MHNSSSYRTITIVGLAQGVLLYLLYYGHEEQLWPASWGLAFNLALFLCLFMPWVFYWSQDFASKRTMLGLCIGIAGIITGIVSWQVITAFPGDGGQYLRLVGPASFIGLFLVCFMWVPLVTARAQAGPATLKYWDYAKLFEISWRNALVSAQAGLLTGLFWAVLLLGAQLFHMIGIDAPRDLLREPWLALPLTSLSFALAYRAGLLRPHFAKAVRVQWMSITTWLLPVTSLIGASFTLASLSGVESLFDKGLSSFFLLWFAAFWVCFYNSAYQDGQEAPAIPAWMQKALPWLAAALLAVAGMASWALFIRIQQYGLTPDRVWGALVAAVGLTYGLGYLLPARKSQAAWMPQIATTNLIAALLMCAGILLLLSPIMDARRLSANSQIQRLASGQITPDQFDADILGHLGRFGHKALQDLIAQREQSSDYELLTQRAEITIAYASKRDIDPTQDLKLDKLSLEKRLDIYPAGTTAPEGFLTALQQAIGNGELSHSHCLKQAKPCPVLFIDLNHDKQAEAILWESGHGYQAQLYSKNGDQWQHVGRLQPYGT
ncbi:MAG: hypothetical protein ACPHER_06920, partial [Nevskiales bacterium]